MLFNTTSYKSFDLHYSLHFHLTPVISVSNCACLFSRLSFSLHRRQEQLKHLTYPHSQPFSPVTPTLSPFVPHSPPSFPPSLSHSLPLPFYKIILGLSPPFLHTVQVILKLAGGGGLEVASSPKIGKRTWCYLQEFLYVLCLRLEKRNHVCPLPITKFLTRESSRLVPKMGTRLAYFS